MGDRQRLTLAAMLVTVLIAASGMAATAHGTAAASAQEPPVFAADKPSGAATAAATLGDRRIAAALVQALDIATTTVVARLGGAGGFADDPAVRIPLPGGLAQVRQGLFGAGLGPLVADLEARMNRAAEAAMPAAGSVLGQALATLTIEDATGILTGPDDAATRHFEASMRTTLLAQLTPIVEAELREAGAVTAFDAFLVGYSALPLMPDIRGSLTGHVVDRALAGLLHYVAEEERAIRQDPVARTTVLLRRVFGDS